MLSRELVPIPNNARSQGDRQAATGYARNRPEPQPVADVDKLGGRISYDVRSIFSGIKKAPDDTGA
jgi:hypothetical protein